MMTYSHRRNPYLRMYFSENDAANTPAQQPAQTAQQQEQDPGFLKSFQQGFGQQYQAQKDFSSDEVSNFDAYKDKYAKVIEWAKPIAKSMEHFLHKHEITTMTAITCIAAGVLGGPATVVPAALTYWVNKLASKGVHAAFDAGQKIAGQVAQANVHQQLQPEHLSFEAYFEQRMMLDESLWSDVGKKAGQAVGYVAGKIAKWGGFTLGIFKNMAKMFVSQAAAFAKFAANNKITVAKAMVLTGISIMIGAGVGSAVKVLTTPEYAQAIAKAAIDSGVSAQGEMAVLLGKEVVQAVKDAPHHVFGSVSHAAHATAEFGANMAKSAGAEAGVAAGSGALTGLAMGH